MPLASDHRAHPCYSAISEAVEHGDSCPQSRTGWYGPDRDACAPVVLLLLIAGLAGCSPKAEQVEDATASLAQPQAAQSADWPSFRGDPALRGVAPRSLVLPLELQWTYKSGAPVVSSAVVTEGKVFVGSTDGVLHAIALNDGRAVWTNRVEDSIEAPPLVLNGRVFVGDMGGTFHAMDSQTGQGVWTFKAGDKIVGAANWFVQDGRANLLVGSHDFFLYALDAATGATNWAYETGNYINGTPATVDGLAVVGGCDALLHVVSVTNGTELRAVDAGAYIAAGAALDAGRAWFGHYENEFLCVDLNAGSVLWRYRQRNFPYLSSPALTGNRVLFGGRDKRLHCVNRDTGDEIWTFATRGKVDSSPVVCGDQVAVGSDDGRLYVVSLAEGNELWSYEIGQPLTASPAVADGKIIIGSADGNVYCFGE
jgi:outer membrane protein assembly factor BamB